MHWHARNTRIVGCIHENDSSEMLRHTRNFDSYDNTLGHQQSPHPQSDLDLEIRMLSS